MLNTATGDSAVIGAMLSFMHAVPANQAA
jgi:hypothetical protein